jgi:hypothetical protein
MSTENKILDLSFPAIEDLSNDQYRFVVLTSTGVRRPNNETEACIGILQNAPVEGEAAAVRVIGVSKLQMNDAGATGLFVKAEYVDAADAGKGKTSVAALAYSRAMVMEAADAEDDLASVLLIGQVPGITDTPAKVTVVTTKATAGAVTYSVGEITGGMILRDPAGASRSDVTPTAADLVAGIAGAIATSSLEFGIRNTADANETVKLTAGAGVTLSGEMTIGQNSARRFLLVVTNAGSGTEAVTIYNAGPAVQETCVVTTKTTAGAATYTAAELVNVNGGGANLVLRDPTGGDRSDVTPTAALLVAAIPGAVAGSAREFCIRNTADAAETITITAGDAGVTLSGTMTIAQNNTKRFRAVVTNAGAGTEAVTVYSLGTFVH